MKRALLLLIITVSLFSCSKDEEKAKTLTSNTWKFTKMTLHGQPSSTLGNTIPYLKFNEDLSMKTIVFDANNNIILDDVTTYELKNNVLIEFGNNKLINFNVNTMICTYMILNNKTLQLTISDQVVLEFEPDDLDISKLQK